MKFTLPTDAVQLLMGIADTEQSRTRALLLIKNSNVSDDVRDAFTNALQKTGESNMKLIEALKVEGMDDYIDSKVNESLSPVQAELDGSKKQLEDANANIQKLETENKELKANQTAQDAFVEEKKNMLIDQISNLALALRKSEINLESVEDSLRIYKEKLAVTDDLKSVYDSLHAELLATFAHTPTVPVTSDTQQVDPTNPPTDPTKDPQLSDEDPVQLTDMASLIRTLDKTAKKQN
ncbi:hypothetical protein [Acinetobacter sp.]|uniref:hypothetical protein n=1 Tax=Acinetobacter sp. TaxID=472 RepID=UPI003D0327CE